jgi:hypothetical protein
MKKERRKASSVVYRRQARERAKKLFLGKKSFENLRRLFSFFSVINLRESNHGRGIFDQNRVKPNCRPLTSTIMAHEQKEDPGAAATAAAADESAKIVLVSAEGESFEISYAVAKLSGFLSSLIEGLC